MKKIFLLILFFSIISCSLSSGSPKILTGFVQSSKTDKNDNPVEIYIFDGADEYQIEENDLQEKLLDEVDKKVVVKGDVGTSFSGKKYITIEEYQILD